MLTLYVHYRPRREEGAEFKLKLGLPKRKTVAAMMKAFAKAVAKSDRGYGLTIDVAECFVTKIELPAFCATKAWPKACDSATFCSTRVPLPAFLFRPASPAMPTRTFWTPTVTSSTWPD